MWLFGVHLYLLFDETCTVLYCSVLYSTVEDITWSSSEISYIVCATPHLLSSNEEVNKCTWPPPSPPLTSSRHTFWPASYPSSPFLFIHFDFHLTPPHLLSPSPHLTSPHLTLSHNHTFVRLPPLIWTSSRQSRSPLGCPHSDHSIRCNSHSVQNVLWKVFNKLQVPYNFVHWYFIFCNNYCSISYFFFSSFLYTMSY